MTAIASEVDVIVTSSPKANSKDNQIHILHVDDDQSNLNISKILLQDLNSNLEIDDALSTDEALKKISTKNYDVIVSDYEMPNKNGLDFLKELKVRNNQTPFILFTGKGREEVAVKALNMGADGYYNKQGDPETVYTELAHGIKFIHEKNTIKKAFKESEEKFKLLADESPNIIFINKKGKVVYANKKAQEIMGYTIEEFLSPTFSFLSITSPESMTTLKEAFSKHSQGEEVAPYEYKLVSKSGRLLDVQINTKLIDFEGGKAILGVVTDITERKKAEAESKKAQEVIRKNNQTIDSIINSTSDLIYALDTDWNFIYANKQMAKIAELEEPAQLVGKNALEIFPLALGTSLEETIRKVMNERQAQQLIFKDSKKGIWENNIFPIENGVTVFAKNITERKKAETALKEDQQRLKIVNEKLQVVGSLTRHDVRNKHSIIKANTYLLRKKIGNDPESSKLLQSIDFAVEESDNIFEYSRFYEKIGAEKLSPVSVEESFNQALGLVSKNGNTSFENACKGLQVFADTMLMKVFYNLIDNSLKHGERVTHISLNCQEEVDATKLLYADDGVGVPSENKVKIFEGYTTGGSGLGLKLVKKMIEAYGWTVKENGVPEKGARFEITIPRTAPITS